MMRFVEDFIRKEPSVEKVTPIGVDTSKRFFQLHGVDTSERVALRRRSTRAQVLPFFEKLAPTLGAMEACGAAHHWARALTQAGHEVRLIAPQLAKPYVAGGKTMRPMRQRCARRQRGRKCASCRRNPRMSRRL
jgi:transposase